MFYTPSSIKTSSVSTSDHEFEDGGFDNDNIDGEHENDNSNDESYSDIDDDDACSNDSYGENPRVTCELRPIHF